jgi:3-keto-disaccharide hydrolase
MRITAMIKLLLVTLSFLAWAPPAFAQDEWQSLFDGKTLNGWHSTATATPANATPGQFGTSKPCAAASAPSPAMPAGASHWEIVDGLLTACGDPAGYLVSDRTYKNFVLSLEFKTGADTNSGVFVRNSYEVQIWKQQPAGYNTGGIVNTAKTARDFAFKADDWNLLQITADGDHLIVVLNGETTVDVHDARSAEGTIRLQYQQYPIAFRNLRIRVLP